ncbi:MAG TPA: extracellular solute-binding protein, partial [Acidimicrobiales bacterium]|nr:extracellular solute-binding protein [Acidimicrobiales bacterium]
MNQKRSRTRLFGTLAATTLAFGGLAVGFAGSAGASRLPGRTLPQAVDGVTPASSITLWTDTSTGENWQQPLVAGFEKATGISVTYDGFPQTTMQDKIESAQETKSTDFQIYDEPESLTPNYVQLNGVLPINSFKADTTLTPASYDAAGIPPGATSQCTLNGEQYCYPTDVDPGPELFYNISMLRA